MKTLTTTMLALCLTFAGNASDTKYLEAMKKNIASVYQAQTIDDLQKSVNSLERIGSAEKDKWEPFYYASFGYIMMSTRVNEPTKKDALLDQAKSVLMKASEASEANSEIVALEGFILMMKVSVDPASRGAQLSGQAMQSFGKALSINPDNPRALSLMAQMQLGTSKFFNTSPKEACDTAKRAVEKFDSFKSDNPLAPQWGREMTVELVNQCN